MPFEYKDRKTGNIANEMILQLNKTSRKLTTLDHLKTFNKNERTIPDNKL